MYSTEPGVILMSLESPTIGAGASRKFSKEKASAIWRVEQGRANRKTCRTFAMSTFAYLQIAPRRADELSIVKSAILPASLSTNCVHTTFGLADGTQL